MAHLELVSLIVEEYDPAIRFFVDVLGFELVEDSPATSTHTGQAKRWVVVRPPGAATGILLARANGDVHRAAIGDQFAGRVGLFLRVENNEDTKTKKQATNNKNETKPRSEPYG